MDFERLKQLREKTEALVKIDEDPSVTMRDGLPTIGEFHAAANPKAVLSLLDDLEDAMNVLAFYANEDNWMTTRKDELHEARMTIAQDAESFGYQRDEYSPNIVRLIGGKMAREILNKWRVK